MYLCFETEDKRMAFPEHSLVNFDDLGFTVKAMAPGKSGDMIFLKLASYQGCVPDFPKALAWIKKKPKTVQSTELEFTNSAGASIGAAAAPRRPAQPQQQAKAQKLPETPSF